MVVKSRKEIYGHKGMASIAQYEDENWYIDSLQTGEKALNEFNDKPFKSENDVRNWLREDSISEYLNEELKNEEAASKKSLATEIIDILLFLILFIVIICIIRLI